MPVQEDAEPALEAALHALLQRCPDALVGAVSADASVEAVEVPPALPLGPGHRLLGTGRLIDLFSVPDQAVLSKLWGRARSVGAAVAPVTLNGENEQVLVFFFSVARRYGATIIVVTGSERGMATEDGEIFAPFENRDAGDAPVRVARAWKDGSALISRVDDAFTRLLGWPPEDVAGRRSLELIHPDDHETAIDNWLQMLDFPGPGRPVRLRHRHRDGGWVWVELTNHNRLADPAHGDVMAEMVDISEEVAATEAALARQQLIEQITETLPLGLFHAGPNGRLLYANSRLQEIAGLAAGESLLAWGRLLPAYHRNLSDTVGAALAGLPGRIFVELEDPRLGTRNVSVSLRPLSDASGVVVGITGSAEDVTEQLAERRALEARAATDAFTECLNRETTLGSLQAALDSIGFSGGAGVAVVFVDVDGLKQLNDRLGHLAGDALLLEMARRLKRAVRAGDIVGRFGGDEFVVVACGVQSAAHALDVARSIASRCMGDVAVEGELVETRASIGVAWTDQPGMQAAWLVRQADSAMYRSKRDGRCNPVLAGV